jgi:hypothetical protein
MTIEMEELAAFKKNQKSGVDNDLNLPSMGVPRKPKRALGKDEELMEHVMRTVEVNGVKTLKRKRIVQRTTKKIKILTEE